RVPSEPSSVGWFARNAKRQARRLHLDMNPSPQYGPLPFPGEVAMSHRALCLAFPLCCMTLGCVFDEPKTPVVSSPTFMGGAPVPPGLPVSRANYPAAPLESAARVDTVGMQLLAANKEIGLQPQFRTIGAPQPEIFHYGTSNVLITDGLVKQCATDGQLAAVLARELAKMVTERETLAAPET